MMTDNDGDDKWNWHRHQVILEMSTWVGGWEQK